MSQVEDWSDGDFDLEHTELRTDQITLKDVISEPLAPEELDESPNWNQSFAEDTIDDGSDEQTDTIKLSSEASSALKRLLQASKDSASSAQHSAHDDLDDQLRPPALDLARVSQYAAGQDDVQTCSTASPSTSASTSYRSMMGLSTDLTDPESPHSKNSAHTTSIYSSHSSDRARSDFDIQSSGPEDSLELDFELAPDLNNLSLCSSLSRARSNTSLSQVSRDVWDDDPATSALLSSTTHTSASSLHPPSLPHNPSSDKSMSGESDADDEHDDVLDGLDLEGSIFEARPGPSLQSASLVKAKLEAILDLKRSGKQVGSADDHGQVTDPDTGIAAGLVITDDFDLSPSRIAARGLPAKINHSSHAILPRLDLKSSANRDEQQLCHPLRTASQHSYRMPVPEISSVLPIGSRSEIRSAGRNRLRFKRSASDLQTHVSTPASNSTASASNRAFHRGSQLTRKRSLPSMRTSPPSTSPSTAAASPSTLDASPGPSSTLSARQRHHSGNSDTAPNSHFRGKGTSRLTDSTAASRARAAETAADQLARLQRDISAPARPSTPITFPSRFTHQPASRISMSTRSKIRSDQQRRGSSGEGAPVARLLKRSVTYGSGAELDGIDDLPGATSPVILPSPSFDKLNTIHPPATAAFNTSAPKNGAQSKCGGRRGPKSKPALIRALGVGASPAHKTVKGMRWNAQALRWEGNESVLRDFDQVIQSSSRPALISQLTGSSNSSAFAHATGYSSPLSPESSTLINHIASGARVVGDMLFDPVQMRWIHKSGDEEHDIFAECDDLLDGGAVSNNFAASTSVLDGDNTVRARRTRSTEAFSRFSNPWTLLGGKHDSGSSAPDDDAHERSTGWKNDQAIRRAISRGVFASNVGIGREFWDACVQAEKRHALEIDGCLSPNSVTRLQSRTCSSTSDRPLTMKEIDRPRPHLYYLEKIAKSIVKPDDKR